MKGTAASATPGDISYLDHMTLSSWSRLSLPHCALPDVTRPCSRAALRVHKTGRTICHICLRQSLVSVSSIAEVSGVSPPHLDAVGYPNVIMACGESRPRERSISGMPVPRWDGTLCIGRSFPSRGSPVLSCALLRLNWTELISPLCPPRVQPRAYSKPGNTANLENG